MRSIIPYQHNPLLRQDARAVPVEEITSTHIRGLIQEMSALLAKEKNGVAMAACQVGEPLAVFIVSGRALAEREDDEDHADKKAPPLPDQVYINPEILKMSRGRKEKHEGCLSIRGTWGMVPRADKATIRAYDENGKRFTRGASGFLAHVFQHEMDHLNGILYIDKARTLYDDTPDDEQQH